MLQTLLDSRVQLEGINDDGFSPLFWVISKQYVLLVKFLIKKGDDVSRMVKCNSTTRRGKSMETLK